MPSGCRHRTSLRGTTSRRPIRFRSSALTHATAPASSSWRGGVSCPGGRRRFPRSAHQCSRRDGSHASDVQGGIRQAACPDPGFFEWQKRADGKQPYRFRTEDLQPFAFAGLWEFARIAGEEILSATIIVGAPNPLAAAIHDRMPVILDPSDYDRWLEDDVSAEGLRALLKPYPAERMTAEAVSRRVNSVKNDDEECIAPIGEPSLRDVDRPARKPDASSRSPIARAELSRLTPLEPRRPRRQTVSSRSATVLELSCLAVHKLSGGTVPEAGVLQALALCLGAGLAA